MNEEYQINHQEIIKNFTCIKEKISIAADKADRDPGTIKLIVVTKKFNEDIIRPILDLGHLDFGENRIQESINKWPRILADYQDISLHLIGPLQTNKTKECLSLFDTIHTLDRLKLASALDKEIIRNNIPKKIFMQINTGLEEQKSGILPIEIDRFLQDMETINSFNITGLMCIPPIDEEPSIHFSFLKKLSDKFNLKDLSMGMSNDFEKAILFGSTCIRIGTGIFGARS
ncbi:YggS family pyridoxal phosphate-dependent enzyme [Hyphomicrobiales bacterium]|jgi:pyridoxal phosphate enzyme (YggS family)|nr:YggS family pyridoxal phosphate-dependent enzyme [Hyphomicrobiales bacterium]|tara:strand:+ start:66 stop:755 length:690 start_codon:yes stop_codon:yes gene_type:complete